MLSDNYSLTTKATFKWYHTIGISISISQVLYIYPTQNKTIPFKDTYFRIALETTRLRRFVMTTSYRTIKSGGSYGRLKERSN